MTIVISGGGSGGHITPLLAVAHELKRQQKDIKVVYVGQKGDNLSDIPAQNEDIDEVRLIRAGKFRRYHGEGLRQVLDVVTLAKNVRDAVWTVVGLWQSFWLLGKVKPTAIFVKGGFVGVPVGLSAALRRIPYVTHDSDALPGLANRIIASRAALHTVALPKEIYSAYYPSKKTVTVGVPLSHYYRPLDIAEIKDIRQRLGVNAHGKVLLVTGGGLGAQRLNDAIASCARELLDRYPDLTILHIAGRANETALVRRYVDLLSKTQLSQVVVKGFTTDLHLYSGVADVIVTRAGATSIAEFAAQHKACIVVPNPLLTGGHQLKNAEVLAGSQAVKLVSEEAVQQDDHALMPAIIDLLDNPQKVTLMGDRLGQFAQPDATKRLAMILLNVASTAS
jgi:UDP-N-acetylglucosamine--N-acetylmuramyl-(pentapeptide) pyrophosphoryl-undecaprenol N-acetylglucosamine transferase